MSQPYPIEFKEQSVQKALTRGSLPLKSVAQEWARAIGLKNNRSD